MSVSLDASSERFLSTLRDVNLRIEKAQREVASGKRLEKPSDAPDSVTTLIEVRSQLSRLTQVASNLDRLRTEVGMADGALSQANTLFDRVRTLAAAGANGSQDAATRATLADEVGMILERMTGLGNSQVEGRYLFSGDTDNVTPLSLDPAATPQWAYHGTQATRRALHPAGFSFGIAKNAEEIFMNADPSKNILQTIENVRQALLTNDDQQILNSINPLSGVSDHINSVISYYGNVLTQMEDGKNSAEKMKLDLSVQKAAVEEADITESLVTLQGLKFQQEAALQVRSKTTHTSLFDYLG